MWLGEDKASVRDLLRCQAAAGGFHRNSRGYFATAQKKMAECAADKPGLHFGYSTQSHLIVAEMEEGTQQSPEADFHEAVLAR